MPIEAQQRTKLSAAQAFESILMKMGYSIMLGGGGGATAHGGPRPIKDADFKMGIKLKQAWGNKKVRGEVVAALFDGMKGYGYTIVSDNTAATKQLGFVLRMEVSDALTGDARLKGQSRKNWELEKEHVEISLTTSGEYDENPRWETHAGPALFLHPLPPGQLVLDKLFVLAQRVITERKKIVSDFEDLASLLERYEANLQTDLKEIRLTGYTKAAKQVGSSPSLTQEVRDRIKLVAGDLAHAPTWSKLQDPQLRALEVKFMIARVERLLKSVDQVLAKVT